MATSDLPPHASLVQGPVPQAQNPSCSILGTSKPSVSTALQSGLFQSFTQTPNSLSCKPCAHASYLYNKPGRLCTIFDQRYVYIHHRDTYILVGLKRWISCGLTLGTRLAWKQCKPHFLSDLADGAKVKCDALSLPETHGFHALVVWQGSKPSLIEEPTEEEEIMVLENHDLQVTCIVAIEGGGGSVDVDINGKSVKVWFTEKVVFVDGRRASTCDIFSSFNKSTNMVFATVHKVLKGGSEATLIYICSCLWSGTRPQAHLLSKLAQGDVYEKTQDGTFMKCNISQRVYCDIPAVLKTSAYGREIVLHSGDEVKHLPITTEDIYYQSASEVFPLPPEIPVLANIARLKGKNKSCVLKVIAVYLPSENIVVSSLSKETKKGFHPTSETKEYLQSKSENNGSGEKGNKLVANDKEEENALMEKSSKGVTKQIEYGQKEGNVKIEDDLERNIQRENAGKEGKIQKEGIVQRDNGQKQGNAKMEKDQEKCSIQIEKREVNLLHEKEKENISQITEETHKGNDICIEDCIWQCGSISQGVAKTLQKYVLITYDVLYVNGKRIPSTDTVAKYSDKGSVVSVAIVPLASSYQVLGLTVTHKAIAAWQGSKPECVENLIKEHASGNDVHKSSKFIPVAKIQISVPCDRVTQSAPSLHESHVASEDLSKSSCAEYVPACRWKVAGISQGLICLKKKVVLVKHEVFFVDKTRVPNTDPMSKFANKESLVNAIVVSISSPQVILGHNITHEALVAWSGKKPDEADSYVAKYSREKSKLGRIPNTRLKTSSLQEVTNVARTMPNSGDEKTFSKEKMKVPGKAEFKKSNADLTLPMKAKTTNDLSSEMRTTENKNMKATDTNAILPINQKKTQPRHAQGKLFKVVGNHGILEVCCRDLEGERAMAAFHRSVTYYLHQQKVDQKRSLEEQLSPHLSTGEDFYCYIVRHDMNIGGVACQYKATMVWVGKKPKLRTECDTGTRVNDSQNAKKKDMDSLPFPGVKRIRNAPGTFEYAAGQKAVLKVKNNTLEGGEAYVYVHSSIAFVHQRRIENASEMSKHSKWQCAISACRHPGPQVGDFVCPYKAELAWVGKMPRQTHGECSTNTSQKETEKKNIAVTLLPIAGPPRIENSHASLAYVKEQKAILKVKKKGGTSFNAFVHSSDAFVHRKRVEKPSDMLGHNVWNCNLKKCDQVSPPLDGFVWHYEAELAWVGKKPSKVDMEGNGETSLAETLGDEAMDLLPSMYEDLFPVVSLEDDTEIVNLLK